MTAVPPLVPVLPPCSLCEHETAYDGASYWCEHCGATWADADATTPGEVNEARCRSTLVASEFADWAITAGRVYRCSLPDGHSDEPDTPATHRGTRIDDHAPPITDVDEHGLVWSWFDRTRGVHVIPGGEQS